MKRIVKCGTPEDLYFIPQWNDGHNWQNYFGYNMGSPYIHIKYFRTPEAAEEWIRSASELKVLEVVKEF